MNKNFKTPQEAFWAGEFGNEYLRRNRGADLVAGNLALFVKILANAGKIGSVIEFGSNIGLNMIALKHLLPDAEFSAIEINETAVAELSKLDWVKPYHSSILEFSPDYQREFALIKGVLIHINPEMLTEVYDRLYAASSRYICLVEYYNPTPVSIPYRGHEGVLFKRDFAGEMLDRFPDLKLVSYGFSYHRDNNFPQDDANWFLLEKS